MSGNIFINYRRDDTSSSAKRWYDRLITHFPANHIFMDVNLDPGVDFVKAIEESVGSADGCYCDGQALANLVRSGRQTSA